MEKNLDQLIAEYMNVYESMINVLDDLDNLSSIVKLPKTDMTKDQYELIDNAIQLSIVEFQSKYTELVDLIKESRSAFDDLFDFSVEVNVNKIDDATDQFDILNNRSVEFEEIFKKFRVGISRFLRIITVIQEDQKRR